jgi:hypothetical protein
MVDAVHRTVTAGGGRARRVRPHADVVVVAAGAAGSTELMRRSRGRALPLSPALGTRISGNGDAMVLSFGGDDAPGAATPGGDDEPPGRGPTITLSQSSATRRAWST